MKCGFQKTLKTHSLHCVAMKHALFGVSAKEELEKVNREIYRLERCKKVLEDILSSEFLKR